jgi:hypothetical protein
VLRDGRRMTAVQLQMEYLEQARKHVEDRLGADADEQTLDVLARWESVLDRLVTDPMSLSASWTGWPSCPSWRATGARGARAGRRPSCTWSTCSTPTCGRTRASTTGSWPRADADAGRRGRGAAGDQQPAGGHPGVLPGHLPVPLPGRGGRRVVGLGDLRRRAASRCSGAHPGAVARHQGARRRPAGPVAHRRRAGRGRSPGAEPAAGLARQQSVARAGRSVERSRRTSPEPASGADHLRARAAQLVQGGAGRSATSCAARTRSTACSPSRDAPRAALLGQRGRPLRLLESPARLPRLRPGRPAAPAPRSRRRRAHAPSAPRVHQVLRRAVGVRRQPFATGAPRRPAHPQRSGRPPPRRPRRRQTACWTSPWRPGRRAASSWAGLPGLARRGRPPHRRGPLPPKPAYDRARTRRPDRTASRRRVGQRRLQRAAHLGPHRGRTCRSASRPLGR